VKRTGHLPRRDRPWGHAGRARLLCLLLPLLALTVATCSGGADTPAAPTTTAPASSTGSTGQDAQPRGGGAPEGLVLIPGGEFQMGDHHNFVDPQHPSDEVPLHTVRLSPFYIGVNDVTNRQYVEFLNSALSQGSIRVDVGLVHGAAVDTVYCDTDRSSQYSPIAWDGTTFTVPDGRADHPATGIRWAGAAAYTNWLGAQNGYAARYDLAEETCDFSKAGYRLPTEAEWEYAARGGDYSPYLVFPWGDVLDKAKSNIPNSGDPYETGPYPWTTPVGFYNGELHSKADFNWPGPQETYQTSDGANGYGLYDMAGNVWQWVNDWYGRGYYAVSPSDDPTGPDQGDPMPDGSPYHVMRGGNWYNGEDGHARVSNRDPGYFRGPEDPNHPYYHVGFRVVLDAAAP
jgi:sulfatase modifying factor 1